MNFNEKKIQEEIKVYHKNDMTEIWKHLNSIYWILCVNNKRGEEFTKMILFLLDCDKVAIEYHSKQKISIRKQLENLFFKKINIKTIIISALTIILILILSSLTLLIIFSLLENLKNWLIKI